MRNARQNMIPGVRRRATLTGGSRRVIGLVCVVLAAAIVSPAQDEQPSPDAVKFKTLVKFHGTNGGNPFGRLVQGTDGYLYGTTNAGGANGGGNVFKMTPSGSLTVLYNFCSQPHCTDGSTPFWIVLGIDANFYGTTIGGGAYNNGTVFKITPGGTLTTLYSFCALPNCADGANPAGLVQGTDGNFYGVTEGGGNSTQNGVVFKITPAGALATLYFFCSQTNCADGGAPASPLIQGADGNLYGTTQLFGAYGGGTVFELTPKGALTTLYSFCAQLNCTDGLQPEGALVQAASSNFYGTTGGGGAYNGGTVFTVTPAGALTTLYSFCAKTNCADGQDPNVGGLLQATDNKFYGTTNFGGNDSCSLGCGTVFEITPDGTLTTLHDFNGTDGQNIFDGVVQLTDGTFYGTTFGGGADADGTVFALSVGLGPFVKTLPSLGKAGEVIKILGTDLTGATSVSFNSAPAPFKVDSETLISAVVPAGATTGFVTVTTPTGTLKSNTRFHIRP